MSFAFFGLALPGGRARFRRAFTLPVETYVRGIVTCRRIMTSFYLKTSNHNETVHVTLRMTSLNENFVNLSEHKKKKHQDQSKTTLTMLSRALASHATRLTLHRAAPRHVVSIRPFSSDSDSDEDEKIETPVARAKTEPDLPVSFSDISRAFVEIRDGIKKTTCEKSFFLSELIGANIFLKAEFRQFTGSFKERGARNAILQLMKEQGSSLKGVIAASAGNHALALAYHGQQLGVPVTVVMPTIAPLAKVDKCRVSYLLICFLLVFGGCSL